MTVEEFRRIFRVSQSISDAECSRALRIAEKRVRRILGVGDNEELQQTDEIHMAIGHLAMVELAQLVNLVSSKDAQKVDVEEHVKTAERLLQKSIEGKDLLISLKFEDE